MFFGVDFSFLDEYKGKIPWHWGFNMVMLRMVSYNTEYYWKWREKPLLDRNGDALTFEQHSFTCKVSWLIR